jgi:hypothetical protein
LLAYRLSPKINELKTKESQFKPNVLTVLIYKLKNQQMKKNLFSALATIILGINISAQETFVNRMFQDSYGNPVFNPILNPFGIQWSRSIEAANGDIITVGHTYVSGDGENIHLIRRASDGSIVFQNDYDVNSNNYNDYGIDVFEASNGDIYVCGTTDNGGSTNYDGVILRLNSGGTLLNSTTYSGASGKNDIATALKIHPTTGDLIVALTTENTSTSYDYLVLKLNANNLSTVGAPATYDYSGLIDIALGLAINPGTGNITVIGGSQSSLTESAYALARFNSSLVFISDTRTDLTGTPYDQPLAFKIDANNNIYVTGKTLSGSTYDIRTVKINSNYSIAWNVTLDINGLDDIGNTIDIDPTNGNIVVGGICTRSGNITDMLTVRYNGSNGSMIGSTFIQSSENTAGNAGIKKLCTSSFGDVYFVAGEQGNSGFKQVIVGKLNQNGLGGWQKKVISSTQDMLPSDIEISTDGIYAISVKDSTPNQYIMTGYEELTLDSTKFYQSSKPAYMAHELLIDFHPSAINKTAIDNQVGTRIAEFGDLSDFLTTSANNAVNLAFEGICNTCPFKAVRVHSEMKTTDTLSVSRLNMVVPNPPVWSILLVQIPNTVTVQKAKQIFNSIKPYVSAVQYDNCMEVTSPPNDSLYSGQANLHAVTGNSNAHINVEDAWNVVTNCGASFVKCGVFDLGVLWRHKDFGYTGSPGSGKVKGWLFGVNFGSTANANGGVDIHDSIYIIPDAMFDLGTNNGHGTAVAGVIGAKRNNTSGISGIAGGDDTNGNNGVSLYSLNVIGLNKMFWVLKAMHAAHGGPTASSLPYNYKLHLSNHSYKVTPGWWGPDSLPLYRDEVHQANRWNVTFVASRGNDSTNNFVAPANYDSCWAVSVGASNASGLKWSGSSYGSAMDVIAPGTTNIVTSLGLDRYYKTFSGTSAAAPHASGVVALLMSYMNNPSGQDDYMNLAPEDCDFIIQRSATDIGPTGYDSINGYGRLNAGAALRMVEKPYRILYHFGTNAWTPHTISKSVYANYDTVRLTEKYVTPNATVYNPGKYWVKTFEIQATVSHPGLYPTDSIMYHWPRPSSSNVFDLPNAQKKLDLHQRTKFVSFSPSSATLKGYIYQVKDSTNTTVLGWWPCDTSLAVLNQLSQSLIEYSVLSKNKAVGIKELETSLDNISLYPNPANQSQTLLIKSDKESDCKVELYDLQGRYIKTVFNSKIHLGKNNISHDVANLVNSMYIYIISIDGKTTSKKFIKE